MLIQVFGKILFNFVISTLIRASTLGKEVEKSSVTSICLWCTYLKVLDFFYMYYNQKQKHKSTSTNQSECAKVSWFFSISTSTNHISHWFCNVQKLLNKEKFEFSIEIGSFLLKVLNALYKVRFGFCFKIIRAPSGTKYLGTVYWRNKKKHLHFKMNSDAGFGDVLILYTRCCTPEEQFCG